MLCDNESDQRGFALTCPCSSCRSGYLVMAAQHPARRIWRVLLACMDLVRPLEGPTRGKHCSLSFPDNLEVPVVLPDLRQAASMAFSSYSTVAARRIGHTVRQHGDCVGNNCLDVILWAATRDRAFYRLGATEQ